MMPLSCRISLSPFLKLRHHPGTVSRPSITFQTFPSHSSPSSPLHSLLHQHSHLSLPFPASPFLSAILLFYPYPISVRHSPFLSVPCFYPLIPCFCLAVSWTKLLSNITINRCVVLSHFTVHLHFLSIYKPVYLGS